MYRPKDRDVLKKLILDCYRGELYLLDIDTSLITDMSYIFNIYYNRELHSIDINKIWDNPNNDISNWDTSNVTDMSYMFSGCEFNQDISIWNVSNVTDMSYMFAGSSFSRDLSLWVLMLDRNTNLNSFNNTGKHSKLYGYINNYNDFIKTVKWDRVKSNINIVKSYIKDIFDSDDDKKRYELLKRLNSIKQLIDTDMDIKI